MSSESDKEEEEDPMKKITEEFVEVVKNWVKIDDEIRKRNVEIKDLKNEKKEFEGFILEYMGQINENVINISDGKLRLNKSKTKGPLKQDSIQKALFDITKDSNKAVQMTKYILDSRPVTERVNLKRTKFRGKKNKKGNNQDI